MPAVLTVALVCVARAPRLIPVGLLGGALVGLALAPKVLEFAMGGDNEYSLFTRVEAWRIMGEIIAVNPILGVGFANYYWYTPLYPILGYAVSFNSHNNYVDILAQTGVLGMICFLWFGWALGRYTWRLRQVARPGFEQAYVYGAFGGVVGTFACGMLGDWLLPFVYNIGYNGFRSSVLGWLFMGGVVALGQIIALDRSALRTSDVDK
jgi:O-antigen ligase